MTLTTKLSETTVKATNESAGEIVGYASTFGNIDSYGDSIAAGAFTETLKKHASNGTTIPLLFEHDRALYSHVGVIVDASEDDTGLLIRAQLDMDSESGRRAFKLAKGRRVNGMSIGFVPTDVEPGNVDGKSATLIKGIDLREVSLVLNPADSKALVTSVKSADVAPPRAPEIITRSEVSELRKSFSEDTAEPRLHGTIDERLAKLNRKQAADDYRAALLDPELEHTIPDGPSHQRRLPASTLGAKLPAAERQKAQAEAIDVILSAAERDDRGLTADESHHIQRIKADEEKSARSAEGSAAIRRLFSGDFTAPDDVWDTKTDSFKNLKEKNTMTTATKSLALTPKARQAVATKAAEKVADFQTKAAVNTGGAFDVPTIVEPNIVGLEAPAASILEIIDTQVTTSPTFAYVKQTARDNNAAVVPVGEIKPKSEYGFTRVDESLDVVAHIASGIDQYMLTDTAALSSFLQAEMINGVYDKVEHLVAEAIASAEGALTQSFEGDLLSTTRAALTTFQTAGLTPAAFMLNPQDWQDIELSKTEGSGAFIFGATPVNQIERTLWSVPVVISHRVAPGAGHVLAADSVRLYHDGTLGLAWDASGELFERNQVAIRAEGRFKPVVLRETGIINLTTAAA